MTKRTELFYLLLSFKTPLCHVYAFTCIMPCCQDIAMCVRYMHKVMYMTYTCMYLCESTVYGACLWVCAVRILRVCLRLRTTYCMESKVNFVCGACLLTCAVRMVHVRVYVLRTLWSRKSRMVAVIGVAMHQILCAFVDNGGVIIFYSECLVSKTNWLLCRTNRTKSMHSCKLRCLTCMCMTATPY